MLKSESYTAVSSLTKEDIINDYRIANESRHASLLGRKEVFMGKAKFGIFGDGKEVAQLAMARAFKPGDWRSGYYRDQTFMLAAGMTTLQQYFAQLYAHTDVQAEPASGGRLMNGHFGTRLLDEQGQWLTQTDRKNSSSDVSPTGSQMPRLLGLAWASKLFRQNQDLQFLTEFSVNGNEVAWGTIGNASTSEGMFFEAINAAGVLQVPMLMSVWDDEFGISVSKEYHTTKGSISAALAGFQRTPNQPGYEIFTVNGWDYESLLETYAQASDLCRTEHVPVLVHVKEMTQPQGHSTSGSHERYKTAQRLQWEAELDCIKKMREWILESEVATADELDAIEKQAAETAKEARNAAWAAFQNSIKPATTELAALLRSLQLPAEETEAMNQLAAQLEKEANPILSDALRAARKALRQLRHLPTSAKQALIDWKEQMDAETYDRFDANQYSQSSEAITNITPIAPEYSESSAMVDGREVMRAAFDAIFARDPRVVAFGEDVGKIGDVNQGFAGLQEKYGELRITDTSIRECTIMGQGIGLALRGLRPIAEIQYLDYLNYAIQIMSDDVACLQYRTRGGQKAPLIVRTRGHRLEGIWHAGSPMGMILNSIRGIHVLVPRDMTRAAAFYNTMLKTDEPALIIECLNGYRLKERMPENIGQITLPLGQPETLRQGTDVTIVTYGSMCRVVLDAATELETMGISCEVIDVQTLLPFDVNHSIVKSVMKTNRLICADEDVPGGASAFMLQQIVEGQGAFRYLDSAPLTIAAKEHRPAYSSDGDYFSKPSPDDVIEVVYNLMREVEPTNFPPLF